MDFWEMIRNWLNGIGNYALGRVFPACLLLVVGTIVIRIVMKMVNKGLEKSRLEKVAHTLIRSVIRVAMYLLMILIIASFLGFDVTGVVALASVLTLAVSLSVQNALTNVIGGFQLLYTKPFASGDYVEVASQSGTVQEIGLTYTKLATADNKIISIPNSAVVSSQIVNYTVSGTRRVTVNVSASYESPIEDVLEALTQAGDLPTRLPDKEPFVAVSSYGESCVNYVLHIWCKTDDYWTTQFEANKLVKAVFEEKGVKMTYPHLNVHLDK